MTAARHASTAITDARFFVFGVAGWLVAMAGIMAVDIVDGAFIPRLSAALKQRDGVQRVLLLLMLPGGLYTFFVASRGHRALMRPRHRSRMMPARLAD